MAYFIFQKNLDNIEGTLVSIAENKNDLDVLNFALKDYKILEDNIINFNLVKLNKKYVQKYNNDLIFYEDANCIFPNKKSLEIYISNFKKRIQDFLNFNTDHSKFSQWNDYLNQLNSLNLDNFIYPLNKSLEQHFYDSGQPSYNVLQIP
jgi:hypothetical protein